MANYFSKYQGRGGPAIAPGIVQMMGSIGDEYAKGIEGLAEGIDKYRQNKEKREILTEKGEWVANQKMQNLAAWIEEDPQRIDSKEHDEKLKDIQKFGEGIVDMPLGKLESAISNYAMDVELENRRQTREIQKAEVEESRRRFNLTQQATEDYRNTQTGRNDRSEQRILDDRATEATQSQAARDYQTGALAMEDSQAVVRPAWSEVVDEAASTPQEPVELPPDKQDTIDELLLRYNKRSPEDALKKGKSDVAQEISSIEATLKSIGATRNPAGEIAISATQLGKPIPTHTPQSYAAGWTAFTPAERANAKRIDAYNAQIKKDPNVDKTIQQFSDDRAQAETLFTQLDTFKNQQRDLTQTSAEEISQYLSPVHTQPGVGGDQPTSATRTIYHPAGTQEIPYSQSERFQKQEALLAKHGVNMSPNDLAKFRGELNKLDPNQPSPFRYEKGPNNTWLATHQGTGATVNLGQEGHMSATEIGYIHKRAGDQLKRLTKAKDFLEKALFEYDEKAADGMSSEAELKPLRDRLERAKAALEQEQPILKYGPDGWEN